MCGFSIVLILKRNYDVLKSKNLCFLLIGNNKNETKMDLKWKIPHTLLKTNLVLAQES